MRGGPAGDLYVITYVKSHDIFERRGSDLWCEIPVSFTQAALGATITVPMLVGEPEKLNIAEGTQYGEVYTLKEKGMPDPHGRGKGNLNVIIKVKTPTRLTDEEKSLLKQLAELRGDNIEVHEEKGFFERVKDVLGGR
jgi:molecular chaperone DnaJ